VPNQIENRLGVQTSFRVRAIHPPLGRWHLHACAQTLWERLSQNKSESCCAWNIWKYIFPQTIQVRLPNQLFYALHAFARERRRCTCFQGAPSILLLSPPNRCHDATAFSVPPLLIFVKQFGPCRKPSRERRCAGGAGCRSASARRCHAARSGVAEKDSRCGRWATMSASIVIRWCMEAGELRVCCLCLSVSF